MKKNKGFTLLELLIATMISFLVVSTAIDIVYSSSKSSAFKKEMSKVQQEGLFISILLVNDLYKAGDLDYGRSTFDREPFNWDKTGAYDSKNDQISIRFYNHDNVTNCSGDNTIGVLENNYKLSNGVFTCNDIEISSNVERFNLKFGVDISGDGNIDRFVSRDKAKEINESTDSKIIAVSYSLLIKSEEEHGFDSLYNFKLANDEIATYDDGYAYRLFKRTILLRNML